jgi:hypothetical protein
MIITGEAAAAERECAALVIRQTQTGVYAEAAESVQIVHGENVREKEYVTRAIYKHVGHAVRKPAAVIINGEVVRRHNRGIKQKPAEVRGAAA